MTKLRFLTTFTLAALLLAGGTRPALAGGGGGSGGSGGDDDEDQGKTTCSKCVFIDLYDGAHTTDAPAGSPWILPDINGGKGVSVGTLVKGQTYLVTITGWVSYWFKSLWDANPGVGFPVAPPKYFSDAPGAPSPANQTKTGYDWECLFAYPQFAGVPVVSVPLHFPQSRVSLDGGTTFFDPVPLGGQACAPDHTYRYLLVGKGAPAFFRIRDTGPTYDNYGKYKICVQSVCSAEGEHDDKDPEEDVASPSLMSDGVFDPRLIKGTADR